MAVSSQLPGLTVSVKVAGKTATEYDAPREETPQQDSLAASAEANLGKTVQLPPRTRCFIESTSGLSFTAEIEVAPEFNLVRPYDHLMADIFIDGTYATGACKFIGGKKPSRPRTMALHCALIKTNVPGQFTKRKFMFASVAAVEDASQETVIRDTNVTRHLGTILVKVWIAYGEESIPFEGDASREEETFELAEKSMKGRELTHATKFSKGSVCPEPSCFKFRKYRHVGDFEFMYRSRSALQKEMCLPPSRSPSLPADDRDSIDNMGEEELREFAKNLQKKFAASALEAKREPDDKDGILPQRKAKRAKVGDARDIVDLTSD